MYAAMSIIITIIIIDETVIKKSSGEKNKDKKIVNIVKNKSHTLDCIFN